MAGRLILLCETSIRSGMEQACVLPHGLMLRYEDGDWRNRPDEDHILHIDPSGFLPDSEAPASTDVFLEKDCEAVAVQVAVIRDNPQSELNRLISERKLLAERLKENGVRRNQLTLHTALILTTKPGPECYKLLKELWQQQRLQGGNEENGALFAGALYLMGPKTTAFGDESFHSRHIWPAPICHLLVRLLAEPPKGIEGRVLCWRARAFSAMQEEDLDRKFEGAFKECVETLKGSSEIDDKLVKEGSFSFGGIKEDKRQINPPEDTVKNEEWNKWKAKHALNQATNHDKWNDIFTENLEPLHEKFDGRALSSDPKAWNTVSMLWGEVHKHPEAVQALLVKLGEFRPPNPRESLKKAAQGWRDVQVMVEREERALNEAEACREELEKVQKAFLPIGTRIVVAFAISGLVAYAAFMLFWDLFGSFKAPLLITGVGVLGSLFASLFLGHKQNEAGKESKNRFADKEGVMDRAQTSIKNVHDKKISVLRAAHIFWGELAGRGAALRLEGMLKRLKAVINHGLRADLTNPDTMSPAPSLDEGGQDERDRWLKKTSILVESKNSRRDLKIDPKKVDQLITRYLKDPWTAHWVRRDIHSRGDMPLSMVYRLLHDFRSKYKAGLLQELHGQIQRENEPALQEKLNQAYRKEAGDNYLYGLSLEIPEGIFYHRQKNNPLLICGKGPGAWGSSPTQTPLHLDALSQTTLHGLFFQEIRISEEREEDLLKAVTGVES